MHHFVDGPNMGMCLIRNSRNGDFVSPFVIEHIATKDVQSSLDGCNIFPLYRYEETLGGLEKTPNLNPSIVAKIEETAGPTTPEDVFHYVYAVLHVPEWRAKFKEFLKVDFPKIPYPKDAAAFRRLADLGRDLVTAHLLRDPPPPLAEKTAAFPVAGDCLVERVEWDAGRVRINAAQYFANVDEADWTFAVGGYQPAQKWLKDRKGRVLSPDDLKHYRRLVLALRRTRALQSALSAAWPTA